MKAFLYEQATWWAFLGTSRRKQVKHTGMSLGNKIKSTIFLVAKLIILPLSMKLLLPSKIFYPINLISLASATLIFNNLLHLQNLHTLARLHAHYWRQGFQLVCPCRYSIFLEYTILLLFFQTWKSTSSKKKLTPNPLDLKGP